MLQGFTDVASDGTALLQSAVIVSHRLTLVVLVLMQAALLDDLDVINGVNHLLCHSILHNVVSTAV